jgi:glutamate formiminotransferase
VSEGPVAILLESVVNISEGRDTARLDRLSAAAGPLLLDRHADADHHRSVFTLAGPVPALISAVRHLAHAAVTLLDLTGHSGAHPRLGVLDVVPFVPLSGATLADAVRARDSFAVWAGDELGIPCFLYGPLSDGTIRSLPQVRQAAFGALAPHAGPGRPHPTAGAAAVGAREAMVAYNLWLEGQDAGEAGRMARILRSPTVRALGFELGGVAQLSFNLLQPAETGPAEVYDRAASLGARIGRAELVGLVPAAVLDRIPYGRWAQLDLDPSATIEARMAKGAGRDYPSGPTSRPDPSGRGPARSD